MNLYELIAAAIGSLSFGIACACGLWVATPIWDRFAEKTTGNRVHDCVRLDLSEAWIRNGLRIWGLLLVINMLVFTVVLEMLPVGLAVEWLVFVAPNYILDFLYERRRAILRDQMVAATVGLASTVEAGLGLPQGLSMVTDETPFPLNAQLKRIVADFNRGRPLHGAILAIRKKLKIECFTLFAAAIQVALDQGGSLNNSLKRISRSLQENQRLERKIASETAGGKRIVQILALFPLGFLLLMQMVAPAEVGYLYSTLIGQCILAAAIMIDYAGVRMAVRMIRLNI